MGVKERRSVYVVLATFECDCKDGTVKDEFGHHVHVAAVRTTEAGANDAAQEWGEDAWWEKMEMNAGLDLKARGIRRKARTKSVDAVRVIVDPEDNRRDYWIDQKSAKRLFVEGKLTFNEAEHAYVLVRRAQ